MWDRDVGSGCGIGMWDMHLPPIWFGKADSAFQGGTVVMRTVVQGVQITGLGLVGRLGYSLIFLALQGERLAGREFEQRLWLEQRGCLRG